jgi:hypothetical protein
MLVQSVRRKLKSSAARWTITHWYCETVERRARRATLLLIWGMFLLLTLSTPQRALNRSGPLTREDCCLREQRITRVLLWQHGHRRSASWSTGVVIPPA